MELKMALILGVCSLFSEVGIHGGVPIPKNIPRYETNLVLKSAVRPVRRLAAMSFLSMPVNRATDDAFCAGKSYDSHISYCDKRGRIRKCRGICGGSSDDEITYCRTKCLFYYNCRWQPIGVEKPTECRKYFKYRDPNRHNTTTSVDNQIGTTTTTTTQPNVQTTPCSGQGGKKETGLDHNDETKSSRDTKTDASTDPGMLAALLSPIYVILFVILIVVAVCSTWIGCMIRRGAFRRRQDSQPGTSTTTNEGPDNSARISSDDLDESNSKCYYKNERLSLRAQTDPVVGNEGGVEHDLKTDEGTDGSVISSADPLISVRVTPESASVSYRNEHNTMNKDKPKASFLKNRRQKHVSLPIDTPRSTSPPVIHEAMNLLTPDEDGD